MTVDPLALAEAVASGAMTQTAAESAIGAAHGSDTRRAEADIAEMNGLVTAIRGVRRHAQAFHAVTDATHAEAAPAAAGTVAPRRVDGGDVRFRPLGAASRPGWAVPGLLTAAAVVVVAVIVGSQLSPQRIAATPSPSSPVAIASPSPSPADGASPIPSTEPTPVGTPAPTPAVTPVPTAIGVPGVPAIVSQALTATPGIAYWRLTAEDTITVSGWNASGSAPTISFRASTWPDPARDNRTVIDRRVVVSPDGTRIAFMESDPRPPFKHRLRVFDTNGRLVWTDPTPADATLAWSPDGTRLAIGRQPGMWRIVTFGSGSPSVKTLDLGDSYALLGFSASGLTLYGYNSSGEAEYWGAPMTVSRDGGALSQIDRFSGAADPLAQSNGTTPTTTAAQDSGSVVQPGVDPKTGRVLDRGGASGRLQGWEIRDGTATTPLPQTNTGPLPAVAWGPDGSLVIMFPGAAGRGLQLVDEGAAAPYPVLAPALQVPAGTYWQQFGGVRGSTALIGLGAARAGDVAYRGADELVAVDLTTANAAVLAPADPGLTGLHIAGWITTP